MGELIVKIFFIVVIVAFVGALIYKAVAPNDYQHPRASNCEHIITLERLS